MTTTLVPQTVLTKNGGSDHSSTGNMPVADTRSMSINVAEAGFIMDALTNLYSDPHTAIMREYIANALDSHVEAGVDRPVEVSMPSAWSPNFIVKDFGIGMTKEDVWNYGTYGSSSKRDNLSVVGNFGMGSKSALAVSNSFTVEAVKDGEHTIALIGRDDNGAGKIDIITHKMGTDLPNGVSISIPISRSYSASMSHDIKNLLGGIPSGKILIDGKPNVCILDGMRQLSDDVWVSGYESSSHYCDLSVNVGGFLYQDHETRMPNHYGIYPDKVCVNVPIGSIDLTPSREHLRYTERTRKLLTDVASNTAKAFSDEIKEKTKDVNTLADAVKVSQEMFGSVASLFIQTTLTSAGIPVPSREYGVRIVGKDDDNPGEVVSDLGYIQRVHSGGRTYRMKSVFIDDLYSDNIVFVHNDRGAPLTSGATVKLNKYIDLKEYDAPSGHGMYFLMEASFDPANYGDNTLIGYFNSIATHINLSDVYSAVLEHTRATRKTAPRGKSVRNPVGDQMVDASVIADVSKSPEFLYDITINDIKKNYKDFIKVFNRPKSSGNSIDAADIQGLILAETALGGDPGKFIVINPGNRKLENLKTVLTDLITVDEMYAAFNAKYATDSMVDDINSNLKEMYKHEVINPYINNCVNKLDRIKTNLTRLDNRSIIKEFIKELNGRACAKGDNDFPAYSVTRSINSFLDKAVEGFEYGSVKDPTKADSSRTMSNLELNLHTIGLFLEGFKWINIDSLHEETICATIKVLQEQLQKEV